MEIQRESKKKLIKPSLYPPLGYKNIRDKSATDVIVIKVTEYCVIFS